VPQIAEGCQSRRCSTAVGIFNARDDAGATPLYSAASWGRRDVVELLRARPLWMWRPPTGFAYIAALLRAQVKRDPH